MVTCTPSGARAASTPGGSAPGSTAGRDGPAAAACGPWHPPPRAPRSRCGRRPGSDTAARTRRGRRAGRSPCAGPCRARARRRRRSPRSGPGPDRASVKGWSRSCMMVAMRGSGGECVGETTHILSPGPHCARSAPQPTPIATVPLAFHLDSVGAGHCRGVVDAGGKGTVAEVIVGCHFPAIWTKQC